MIKILGGFFLKVSCMWLLLVGCMISLEFTINRTSPPSRWLTYFSVQPVQAAFSEDEVVRMRTQSEIRRPATFIYHDILYCKERGAATYTWVSDHLSRASHATPRWAGFTPETLPVGISKDVVMSPGIWKYRGESPDVPALCYIDSTISWKPSAGVEKRVKIESGGFAVNPAVDSE